MLCLQPTFSVLFFSPLSEPPGLAEDSEDEDDEVIDSPSNPAPNAAVVDHSASLPGVNATDISDSKFSPEPIKVAGNIARQEFRSFWVNDLKADIWTLNVIQEGYRLPFSNEPGAYQERNNKSARQEKPYLIESVASLKDRGVVKRLQCRPWCTNPLTVSSRLVEGKLKKRLCIDLSRHVNLFLMIEAMTMNTLDKSLALVQPGDWMATYDLTSAFHHIPIHPDHHKYLGFAIENEEGEEEFYAYTCMPFGLATATQCLARVTKAICRFAAAQGIRNSLYIDDGRIGAASKELCLEQLQTILSIWTRAGFVIAMDKTDTADSISQKKPYLGFVIDSVSMTVSATDRKLSTVKQAVRDLLLHPGTVSAKELASVIGKMVALESAFGPVVQLLSRTAQQELSEAVTHRSWRARLLLSDQTKKCLSTFVDHMADMNGVLIPCLHNAVPLEAVLEPSPYTADRTITASKSDAAEALIVASDASDVGHCHYSVTSGADIYHQGRFSLSESRRSSGHRELLAVLQALRIPSADAHPMRGKHILWLTDSTNLCVFLTKGSKKPSIQADVLEVHWLCHDLVVRLTPIHLKRDDFRIQIADTGTRFFDPDDWSADKTTFRSLTAGMRIDLDAFAHTTNAKANRFFSYGRCPRSAAVDAFTQDWTDSVAWICPPVSLIIPAVKKACHTRMSGIFLIPLWRSSVFWTTLFPNGSHAIPQCWKLVKCHPHIVRGQFCYNPLMQGTTQFPFLAVYFVSAGVGYTPRPGSIRCPQ